MLGKLDRRRKAVRTELSGQRLLNDPLPNKGTAFADTERDESELHGLLPGGLWLPDYAPDRRILKTVKQPDEIQLGQTAAQKPASARPPSGAICIVRARAPAASANDPRGVPRQAPILAAIRRIKLSACAIISAADFYLFKYRERRRPGIDSGQSRMPPPELRSSRRAI